MDEAYRHQQHNGLTHAWPTYPTVRPGDIYLGGHSQAHIGDNYYYLSPEAHNAQGHGLSAGTSPTPIPATIDPDRRSNKTFFRKSKRRIVVTSITLTAIILIIILGAVLGTQLHHSSAATESSSSTPTSVSSSSMHDANSSSPTSSATSDATPSTPATASSSTFASSTVAGRRATSQAKVPSVVMGANLDVWRLEPGKSDVIIHSSGSGDSVKNDTLDKFYSKPSISNSLAMSTCYIDDTENWLFYIEEESAQILPVYVRCDGTQVACKYDTSSPLPATDVSATTNVAYVCAKPSNAIYLSYVNIDDEICIVSQTDGEWQASKCTGVFVYPGSSLSAALLSISSYDFDVYYINADQKLSVLHLTTDSPYEGKAEVLPAAEGVNISQSHAPTANFAMSWMPKTGEEDTTLRLVRLSSDNSLQTLYSHGGDPFTVSNAALPAMAEPGVSGLSAMFQFSTYGPRRSGVIYASTDGIMVCYPHNDDDWDCDMMQAT